jgi:hypothetical protein
MLKIQQRAVWLAAIAFRGANFIQVMIRKKRLVVKAAERKLWLEMGIGHKRFSSPNSQNK